MEVTKLYVSTTKISDTKVYSIAYDYQYNTKVICKAIRGLLEPDSILPILFLSMAFDEAKFFTADEILERIQSFSAGEISTKQVTLEIKRFCRKLAVFLNIEIAHGNREYDKQILVFDIYKRDSTRYYRLNSMMRSTLEHLYQEGIIKHPYYGIQESFKLSLPGSIEHVENIDTFEMSYNAYFGNNYNFRIEKIEDEYQL